MGTKSNSVFAVFTPFCYFLQIFYWNRPLLMYFFHPWNPRFRPDLGHRKRFCWYDVKVAYLFSFILYYQPYSSWIAFTSCTTRFVFNSMINLTNSGRCRFRSCARLFMQNLPEGSSEPASYFLSAAKQRNKTCLETYRKKQSLFGFYLYGLYSII